MKNLLALNKTQQGFTILELLIATTVVSVILLLSTIMITNIGNLYYKAISQSKSQDDVRAITDEIAQQLQLAGVAPVPNPAIAVPGADQAYCIGTTRYSYVIGKKLDTTSGSPQHVLWRDTVAPGTCPGPAALNTPLSGGTELIAPRTRLTEFSISSSSPYTLIVKTAFGDDDLLCDSGPGGDCNLGGTSTRLITHTGTIRCKGSSVVNSGQSFCGTSELTTTVVQRKH